tara:strand:+ start:487 stop:666 length:180 start_codon:yes stop_codon:yes gene_type:complete
VVAVVVQIQREIMDQVDQAVVVLLVDNQELQVEIMELQILVVVAVVLVKQEMVELAVQV